jgi:hypothetical protein
VNRVKTFDGTGVAPSGRLYPEDLNAIQDAAAAQNDLTQVVGVATLEVGEVGLQLVRYGAGVARLVGALRVDNGVVVPAGGITFPDNSVQTTAAVAAEVDMGLLIALGG